MSFVPPDPPEQRAVHKNGRTEAKWKLKTRQSRPRCQLRRVWADQSLDSVFGKGWGLRRKELKQEKTRIQNEKIEVLLIIKACKPTPVVTKNEMMILKMHMITPYKFYIYFLHKEHKTSHLQDCSSSECRTNGWEEIHQIVSFFLSRPIAVLLPKLFFFLSTRCCVLSVKVICSGVEMHTWIDSSFEGASCHPVWCSSGCTAEEKKSRLSNHAGWMCV